MTLNPRQSALIEMVRAQGSASIEELARRFGVTLQTVRRDVHFLSEAGLLSRFHGGVRIEASTIENIAYRKRQGLHAAGKQRIAEAVARAVPDGCSLIINIGTTTEAIARALLGHRHLKIITNNLHVAATLSAKDDFEVLVAGGTVRGDGGVVGQAAVDFIEQFRADFALVGISGIDEDGSLLDFDYQEVRVSRAIIDNARQVFLAADSSKFGRNALVRLGPIGLVDRLFTDAAPPPAVARLLAQHKVQLELV